MNNALLFQLGLEVLLHPPYSPDLASSEIRKNYSNDFHKIRWKGGIGLWSNRFWWQSGLRYVRVRIRVGLRLRIGGAPPYSAWERCYAAFGL